MSPPTTDAKLACPACRKSLGRAPASRVFPAYHARCIERAVALAREIERPD